MPVYRYQLTGIDVEDLKEQVPPADAPSISVGAIAGVVVWDVTALATSKPDLDAYFISRGWEFIATDPVDTPAESATADLNFATSIVDVTKAASSAGIADTVARGDHKHDVSTAVAGTIQPDDVAAEGTATSLARSDHKHAIVAAAPTQGIGGGNTEGASASFARADHDHKVRETGGPTDLTIGAIADGQLVTRSGTTLIGAAAPTGFPGFGVSGDVSAIDVGDATAAGVSATAARADHQHALAAPAAPADVTKAAASAGASATVARADHKHDISTAAPSTVGTANSEGTATSVARSDHVHDHGAQALGAGTQHAGATTTVAGFLSPTDKTKIDSFSSTHSAPVFWGGASMGAGDVGKHFGAQEGSNGIKTATLSSDNQMAAGFTGTLAILSWNSESANGTTVFKVNKNGVIVETVTLTGTSGTAALTTAVSAGDKLAVEFDAGTAPGRTTVQVYAR